MVYLSQIHCFTNPATSHQPTLLSITDRGLAGDFAKISKEFTANGLQPTCLSSPDLRAIILECRNHSATINTQKNGENKPIPDHGYAPWPYVIFANDIVPCPMKAETNPLLCSADLCTDSIIACNDEPASDNRGTLDHTKRHVSAFIQRDPTGATAMSHMGIERGLYYDSLSYSAISDWTVGESRYDNVYDAMFVLACSEGRIGIHSTLNLRYHVSKYHPPRFVLVNPPLTHGRATQSKAHGTHDAIPWLGGKLRTLRLPGKGNQRTQSSSKLHLGKL